MFQIIHNSRINGTKLRKQLNDVQQILFRKGELVPPKRAKALDRACSDSETCITE